MAWALKPTTNQKGIKLFGGDNFYIHSLQSGVDKWGFSARAKKKYDKIGKLKAITKQRMSLATQFPDGLSLNIDAVDRAFQDGFDNFAEILNSTVQESASSMALMKEMQLLVTGKAKAATMANQKSSKKDSQATKILHAYLDAFIHIASVLYNQDPKVVVYALGQYRSSLEQRMDSDQQPFYKYIGELCKQLNGKIYDMSQYPDIDALAKNFISALNANKVGATGKIAEDKIRKALQNFLHKDIAEPVVNTLLTKTVSEALSDSIQFLNEGVQHTGSVKISNNSGRDVARIRDSASLPIIKSDGSANFQFDLFGNGNMVQFQAGLNDTWYKVVQGKKGLMIGYHTNKKGQENSKGGTPTASNLTIQNTGSVARYIDELADSLAESVAYSNAYAHSSQGQSKEYIDAVERYGIITGLVGTGAWFKSQKTENKLNDTSLFFVVNGQFYSVYSLILRMLDLENPRKGFTFNYTPGGKNAMAKANKWRGPKTPNLLWAGYRSNYVANKLRNYKVTIKLKPKFLDKLVLLDTGFNL